MRADAQRNRALLLDAARRTFAERGTDASLEEVARRAGVGIGTLYRHFPTRADLVAGVYSSEVENLCNTADVLLATHAPDMALQEWMGGFIDYVEVKRGLVGALKTLLGEESPFFQQTRTLLNATMAKMVSTAVEAGSIRADADPDDLLRGVGGFCTFNVTEGWQDQARRLVGILMDGLRAGAPAQN
ncbi:MAG TPA: helix-turn-helix domain-containing protein [Jatrophihabitans sp.]|jgi:AcrR family transcriptional regulator